ncbi:deoxyribose-phosphate aldolase [Clostridium tetanomorphum]|uniref:Deoxyribose-phosphate aldolase n=1 Tax=Clostridium tetanomorphum TaxID=1553 RepID=A0A923IZH1_CLOTT|nr:deoxyribose-phosphate aldolase [Clostridium tetanomorphum]KAJ53374.1 deoxyribose-phosphate aldolase [Clostridium tetanomorphum DSM 665]MBC2396639.1 deoxyribose-phosphate aldolase [Clostridium tetanomorphum]MBP1863970.1 deoxyribose-phosphate aldolase [Clostridium tetanomorphum]NRS85048.1 deoxyribose-phosphate aldolase [Clostridium tetanomorphum]NRZ98264.1 deoxyribose-phosphate aldolase [Clostridium tetanomorphum]
MNKNELAAMIDHTLLKPEADLSSIKRICEEALKYNFASVCINPCNVKVASDILNGSKVKVCTVIGFPLGATTTAVKVFEAEEAVKNGAEEVDMVINIGRLKDKDYEYVKNDIKSVVQTVKGKALIKVIIETCLLSNEEKVIICKIAKEAGADYVKTSTGFSTGGATISDIKLMRDTVGNDMGVKASGGVRTYEDSLSMIEAGATRIGASASIQICEKIQD